MRHTAVLLGLGILCLTSPVQAQTVTLTPTVEGVTADYRLEDATDRVAFADPGIVRSDWEAGTPGVTLNAEGVAMAAAVEGFRLTLRPDSTEDGRGYIPLTRLGEGYVLHAPSLRLQDRTLALAFVLPDGWAAQPEGPFDGYLYMGPASAVVARQNGAAHVATDPAPTPVIATLLETFDVALAFWTERFGPLPRPPVLSVTRQGAGPAPFRGDVTDSGMISVRLNGNLAESRDAEILDQTAHFAFHETIHLWNSHLARPAEGSPWLHEGGAEYLALVAQVSTGRIDETQARAGLSQRLNDCRASLGDRPDAVARISDGSAIYACGTVIQWLADMELRRRDDTPAGVVAVWTRFIDRARDGRPDYGPADFRAEVDPSAGLTALLDGALETRWAEIDTALIALGVRWQNRPSSQTLIVATLRHLNGQACPPGVSRGFSLRDGYIELGNDAACGPLAGEVALATVEGHDVLKAAPAMFAAVQDRCALGQAVTVMRRGSDAAIAVPCAAALASPAAYDLTETPPIALPPA